MIARQIESWLRSVASKPQVVQIMGLRQTGKTTLLETFARQFPGARHYPLYDLVILQRYASRPEQWVLELTEAILRQKSRGLPLHVFVDEIQKIPAFFQAIQGIYDKHKGAVKFWIWGSSARPLKKHRAETLAGRVLTKNLWPISQSEALQRNSLLASLFDPPNLTKNLSEQEPRGYTRTLMRALTQSLLPEPYLNEKTEDALSLLESYQATYLENEIRRENLLKDIGVFEQFLALAASEDASIANFMPKANALGVSPHTVKNYYEILRDTYVCRALPAYSKSFRVQTSKSPKIYFTDAALARFISGRRGPLFPKTSDWGYAVEAFVINEIFKQIEYLGLPWKLSYFRTKTGLEVDVIISGPEGKIAAEIKATDRLAPRDIQGVESLMELDKEIRQGVIFSFQSTPTALSKSIINIPIWLI